MGTELINSYHATIHDLRNIYNGFTYLIREIERDGLDPTTEDGKKDIQYAKDNLAKFVKVLKRLEEERIALQNAVANK